VDWIDSLSASSGPFICVVTIICLFRTTVASQISIALVEPSPVCTHKVAPSVQRIWSTVGYFIALPGSAFARLFHLSNFDSADLFSIAARPQGWYKKRLVMSHLHPNLCHHPHELLVPLADLLRYYRMTLVNNYKPEVVSVTALNSTPLGCLGPVEWIRASSDAAKSWPPSFRHACMNRDFWRPRTGSRMRGSDEQYFTGSVGSSE